MRWLVMAVAIALAGCHSARSSLGEAAPLGRYRYPAWFLDGTLAPRGGVVGYGPRYATRALSDSLAVQDAAARFRVTQGVRYRAEGAFAALGGEPLAFAGERVVIDTLSPEPAVTVLATAVVGQMTLALVGGASADVMAHERVMPLSPPRWLTHPPRDPRGMVAVGMAATTYREERCWDAAEFHGIQQVARAIGVGLRTVSATTEEGQDAVLEERTDVVLRDVAVLARWRDEARCVVLMRAAGTPGDRR